MNLLILYGQYHGWWWSGDVRSQGINSQGIIEDMYLLILYDQYHGWWWSGDVRSQGINSQGIIEDMYLLILYDQYHGWWWSGDVRSQGINSQGIIEGMDQLILYDQYHGCWWSGDVRSQGIQQPGYWLLMVLQEYTGLSTRRINSLWPSDARWWQTWVNIGTVKDLLPKGIKSLLERKLSYHQWIPMTFIWEQLHRGYLSHQWLKLAGKLLGSNISREQWIKTRSITKLGPSGAETRTI